MVAELNKLWDEIEIETPESRVPVSGRTSGLPKSSDGGGEFAEVGVGEKAAAGENVARSVLSANEAEVAGEAGHAKESSEGGSERDSTPKVADEEEAQAHAERKDSEARSPDEESYMMISARRFEKLLSDFESLKEAMTSLQVGAEAEKMKAEAERLRLKEFEAKLNWFCSRPAELPNEFAREIRQEVDELKSEVGS